ncbi:Protein kinase, putative [Hondaea fermentalgiana]|uniref:non-specific serine/threonine protein kinase n=1 Tax=Hondaea fermentalgiana TaxID=2315210 RepID=A0A2R5G0E8_9STRA|nr:Protein kinase, putative [Hondaea fermentalgiana]|eukprot:GBG24470.1 Protein kinase, putative [Hondaea fermentalgiana]
MCALKRVSVFSNMSRKTRIKCLEEVDLIRALDHVNIIQCLDAFIDKDELIIVLEWASAGDLKRQIRKAREKNKGFQERIIWRYFTQLASAIEHMHAKRIMHRDLKPANVFLMTDGSVKVGDLGLGRALSDTTLTAHSKVGTPLYMSPEVLRGKGYDWKSDVWSLGCILYELAALRSPFKEEGIALPELFRKISNGSYPALNLEGHYSEELGTLVDAMLLVNSERRPDMAEICLRAEAIQTIVRVLAEALVFRVQKVQLRMPDYASVRSDAISIEVDEKHLDDTSSIAEFEHSEGEEEEEEEEYGDDGDRLFGKDDSSLQRHARATSGAIGAPILLPKLDNPSQDSAKAWELEKEKVGLRLQHVSQMCHAQLKGTWRGRQDILSVHKAKLGQECSRAVEWLEGAAAVWAQDLEHIRHGETRIARAFELERDTQSALNAHARTIQSRTDALRLVVNELAERMAELEDQRDKLDVEIQRRSEALSDASSTKNFRAALARLREEVNAMNTKIGIQLQKIEARQQVVLREVKVLHFAQERDEHRSMYHSM